MKIICYDSNNRVLRQLYQWDINQSIFIEGIPTEPFPQFHFCNRLSEEALPVMPTIVDGKLKVDIPNILLQKNENIIIYFYVRSNDSGHRTMHEIIIPVKPRKKPAGYIFEENIEYQSCEMLREEIEEIKRRLDEIGNTGGTIITEGGEIKIDNHTLIFDNSVLKVNTATNVEKDNTLPISSAAVETVVGNIEILLKTI